MPRQSAAVYRRRRLLVVFIIALLIAVVAGGAWLAIAQPWKSTASAPPVATTPPAVADSATPTPGTTSTAPTDTPSPDPSGTPAIVACEQADVDVTAVTDAETYAAGKLPQLSIRLTSKSAVDCTLNVGSSTQKYTVTSGGDVWWRSTDCQTDPSDMIVTLKAGASVTSATPVVWDRTRSSVETCGEKHRARAPGGGASYHVAVSIGGFDSVGSRQIILR
ncbi:hypothetical protein QF046_002911 [Microbacterium sp. W4I4]|uniref:hypothetical protein n=1 Tax=Microbacterium sp. W4I4 TaxID=3042295 RepID=UPI002781F76D|nr:hypothetical protein [Microbacterium sp. W4I4]MDQ0615270.1 hypothetical protein [Microbacterium sp. W4I4]